MAWLRRCLEPGYLMFRVGEVWGLSAREWVRWGRVVSVFAIWA